MKKDNIGSTLDSLLHKEGLYKTVSATARKRVAARKAEAARQRKMPKSK